MSDITDMFTDIKIVGCKTDRQGSEEKRNNVTLSLLKKKQIEAARQSANHFLQVHGAPKDQQFIAAIKQAGSRMTKQFEKSRYSLRNSIYLPRNTNRFNLSNKDFGSTFLSPLAQTQTVFKLRKNQADLSDATASRNDALKMTNKRSSVVHSQSISQAERRKLGGKSHNNSSYKEPSPSKLIDHEHHKQRRDKQSHGHSPRRSQQQDTMQRKAMSKTATNSIDKLKSKVPIKLEPSLRNIEERDSQHHTQSDEDASSSYHPNSDYLNESVLFKKDKLK